MSINAYDIAYGTGLIASAPVWLARSATRRKVIRALRERTGGGLEPSNAQGPGVLIHAVSLGEINATRELIRRLGEARPDLRFIVSVTTDTGFARGRELYDSDPRVQLIRYPLDFSFAIRRVLDGLRPSAVVLMELEVWPNFMRHCAARNIPVLLINGRVTVASFRNYRRGGLVLRSMFRRLSAVCVQDQTYAERFVALGARPDRVRVTGTMKFDTAQIADRIDGAEALAAAVGLRPGAEPIWVCGSTGPGEETILLEMYRRLRAQYPGLRLVLVPRKPERFDEVESLIRSAGMPLIRRSHANSRAETDAPVILGDTMGELRKFYSLADVVFVGRTLVDQGPRQHGSDMIEPAALAKPVVVGPFTGNFAEVMNSFRQGGAIVEIRDSESLFAELNRLLTDPESARQTGLRAREVVRSGQGATARHVELVLSCLGSSHEIDAANPLEQSLLSDQGHPENNPGGR